MKNKLLKKILLLALVFAFSMQLVACGSSDTPAEEQDTSTTETQSSDGVITYALGTSWNTLNPWNNANSTYFNAVILKLFDPLAVTDPAGNYIYRAAKSWDISADGMQVTVYLNENSTWHDGEPVTANDWAWTLKTIADPAIAYAGKYTLSALTGTDDAGNMTDEAAFGAVAVDDYTLQLNLKNATNNDALYSTIRVWFVLPEHLLSDIAPADLETADFWQNPIGSGPCIFESEIAGQEITLLPNENYQLGAPQFSKLIYKVMDSSNFTNALLAGDIDAFYPNLTIDAAKALDGTDGVSLAVDKGSTSVYFSTINSEKFDIKVRQAIGYALDRQMMVDQLLLGEGATSTNHLALGCKYNVGDNTTAPARDVEKAKQLLQEAGWVDGTTITLACPNDTLRQGIAAIIQQQLGEVGINVEIISGDTATLYAGLRDGTYDMGLMMVSAFTYPFETADLWNPSANTFAHVPTTSNVYPLMLELNATQDESERIALAAELNNAVFDEESYIVMFHMYSYWVTSERVANCGIGNPNFDEPWTWVVE